MRPMRKTLGVLLISFALVGMGAHLVVAAVSVSGFQYTIENVSGSVLLYSSDHLYLVRLRVSSDSKELFMARYIVGGDQVELGIGTPDGYEITFHKSHLSGSIGISFQHLEVSGIVNDEKYRLVFLSFDKQKFYVHYFSSSHSIAHSSRAVYSGDRWAILVYKPNYESNKLGMFLWAKDTNSVTEYNYTFSITRVYAVTIDEDAGVILVLAAGLPNGVSYGIVAFDINNMSDYSIKIYDIRPYVSFINTVTELPHGFIINDKLLIYNGSIKVYTIGDSPSRKIVSRNTGSILYSDKLIVYTRDSVLSSDNADYMLGSSDDLGVYTISWTGETITISKIPPEFGGMTVSSLEKLPEEGVIVPNSNGVTSISYRNLSLSRTDPTVTFDNWASVDSSTSDFVIGNLGGSLIINRSSSHGNVISWFTIAVLTGVIIGVSAGRLRSKYKVRL